jgi:ABC-2 type transport system permease protein
VLLRRELKIYKRYEQLIYYLFYPVVFGLIFGLISDDAVASIFTTVLISTIFTTIQSAFLMGREFPFIETTKILPISLGRMIALKATLPVLLGSVLFVGVLTTSILVKGGSFSYFVVVPVVFVLYITSSLLGIRGVLVSPPDQMDNPNTFMRTKFVLLNQVICMGLSFGAIMPLTTILRGASESSSNIWLILIFLASLAVAIVISIFSYRKVKLVINEI